jgi:hypothetical protein
MPLSVSWDDANRTILYVFVEGVWSIEEFMSTLNTVVAYLHKISHPVYIIPDVRQSAAPPLGIIWQSRFVFQRLPGNYAGSVIVTSDNLWRNVVATVRVLYVRNSSQMATARTLEEARKIVQKWILEGKGQSGTNSQK